MRVSVTTLTGTGGLSGQLSQTSVQCAFPTLALSGYLNGSPVSGNLGSVYVICEAQGNVLLLALTMGTPPLFLDFFATGGSFTGFTSDAGGKQTQYVAKGSGVVTVTSTGAHINAPLVELGVTTTATAKVTMTGDLTCSM